MTPSRPVARHSGARETIEAVPYPQPHSVCIEIETPKATRGKKRREGCPLNKSGERRKLPQWSPAENVFYAYLRSERSHLEPPFQYFWATAGPPNLAGPGKPFPLSPLSTCLTPSTSGRLSLQKSVLYRKQDQQLTATVYHNEEVWLWNM